MNFNSLTVSKKGIINVLSDGYPAGLFYNPSLVIEKSLLINLDSNLQIKKFQYYHLQDTNYFNTTFGMCFIDSNESNFLTISSDMQPNSANSKIGGSLMITKNLDDKNWNKIISDTTIFNESYSIIRIGDNRFALASVYYPNNNNPNRYYGKNYVIDSNANVIFSKYENITSQLSWSEDILKTYDGNIVALGAKTSNSLDWDIYCYKYNSDLTPFNKLKIVKNYDTLCTSLTVSSASINLPNPKIIPLLMDSFLSIPKNAVFNLKTNTYPNPVKDNLRIQVAQNNTQFLDVAVYDILGKFMFSKILPCSEGKAEINLAQLPDGQYILIMRDTANKDQNYSVIIKQTE